MRKARPRVPPRTPGRAFFHAVSPRIFPRAFQLNPGRPTDVLPPSGSDARGLPQAELVAAIPRLRRYARVLTGDSARAEVGIGHCSNVSKRCTSWFSCLSWR